MAEAVDDIAKFILDAEVEFLKLFLKPLEIGVKGLGYLLEGAAVVLASPYILAVGCNNYLKLKRLNDINPELYREFLNKRMERGEMPIPTHWMTNREIEPYIY